MRNYFLLGLKIANFTLKTNTNYLLVTMTIKNNNYLFSIALFLLILTSCKSKQELTLFAAPTDVLTDTIKQVYVVNDKGFDESFYKIKANDLITVRNLQNKKFGVTTSLADAGGASNTESSSNVLAYPVDIDGKINLPALGKVEIVNLTIREAQNKIQNLYATNLLVDPIIELNVVNLKVTLLGEFARQGNFYLEKENTNLIEIIGEAGGINKTADKKSLKIIRGERSNLEIIYVNLSDINSLASKRLILQNNDIIILQTKKETKASEKLQNFNSIMQPILVVVNLAILIFTLTK